MYGWDIELMGYQLKHSVPENDRLAALRLCEDAMRLAPSGVIASELARLRSLTKARAEDQQDMRLIVSAFAEELSAYPADAVIEVCRLWARREKWWPAWVELRQRLEQAVKRRRKLLECLMRAA